MRLSEWRQYKQFCEEKNIEEKSEVRQAVYKRLVNKYGSEAILRHVRLIRKILDK